MDLNEAFKNHKFEQKSKIKSYKKTILITGAGSGLGKGAALKLAKLNHKVIAGVEIWPQYSSLKKEAEDMKINFKNFHIVKLDITNEVERIKVFKTWGKDLDILVNNAAIGETGPIAEIPVDRFRKNMEVNVFSTLELTQLFVKEFVKKKSGKIVFISSIAGIKTFPFFGPYCATKFALESISSSLYDELKPFGVDVCTINPGPYNTGFNDRMFDTKDIWLNENNFTDKKFYKGMELFLQKGQYDPEEMIDYMVKYIPLDSHKYRLMINKRKNMIKDGLDKQKELWEREM